MIRSIVVAIVIFAAAFGLQAGVAVFQTRDSSALSQREVDRIVNGSATGVAADTAQTDADAATPTVDSQRPANDASAGQMEIALEDARTALMQWEGASMGSGLLAAITWLVFASARSKKVAGIAQSASAMPHWFGGYLAFVVLAGIAAFAELEFQGLWPKIAPLVSFLSGGLIFLLGSIGYFLSTALGAPSLIRRSVPLAHLISR